MTGFVVKFATGDRVRCTNNYMYPSLVGKEGNIVRVDISGSTIAYIVKFDMPDHHFYGVRQEDLELAIMRNSDDLYKVWRCNSEI